MDADAADRARPEAGPYRLIDCGDGRRLEAFGTLVVDRPAPAATSPRRAADRWADALHFDQGFGWRDPAGELLDERQATAAGAHVTIAGLELEVRPAAGGQVGLFPEHAWSRGWLIAAIHDRIDPRKDALPEVLNLFGYTGLVTLIAAAGGASVVHLDAARQAVRWARRNAELSGLAERPIRWIVDDAAAFVRREARRGRRYAGLILDPPSYGHGRRGGRGAWRFDDRILELLDACAGIAEPDAFWLVTTHTPAWDPERLAAALSTAIDAVPGEVDGRQLELVAESGATLGLGAAARFDPIRPERR